MKGEGHFVALLQKVDGKQGEKCISYMDKKYAHLNLEAFLIFARRILSGNSKGIFISADRASTGFHSSFRILKESRPRSSAGTLANRTGGLKPSHSMIAALRKGTEL